MTLLWSAEACHVCVCVFSLAKLVISEGVFCFSVFFSMTSITMTRGLIHVVKMSVGVCIFIDVSWCLYRRSRVVVLVAVELFLNT